MSSDSAQMPEATNEPDDLGAMDHGEVSTGGLARGAIDKPTADEVSDSLSGWEELAIAAAFNHTLEWMQKNDHELLIMRALAAVMIARDTDAKVGAVANKVMGMTQGEVVAMFSEPVEDADESDPDSESGKGDRWTGSGQTT